MTMPRNRSGIAAPISNVSVMVSNPGMRCSIRTLVALRLRHAAAIAVSAANEVAKLSLRPVITT